MCSLVAEAGRELAGALCRAPEPGGALPLPGHGAAVGQPEKGKSAPETKLKKY